MADVDFPPELPAPVRSGYGFEHVSPFARTSMQTGRARQRRTFQSVPSTAPFTLTLNEPEAQIFEAWFSYDITDGADWFNIDLKTPVGNMDSYECRFIEMYEGPTLSGLCHWIFSFNLELRKRPILDKDFYIFGKEFILMSDIIDVAINKKWPEA